MSLFPLHPYFLSARSLGLFSSIPEAAHTTYGIIQTGAQDDF